MNDNIKNTQRLPINPGQQSRTNLTLEFKQATPTKTLSNQAHLINGSKSTTRKNNAKSKQKLILDQLLEIDKELFQKYVQLTEYLQSLTVLIDNNILFHKSASIVYEHS